MILFRTNKIFRKYGVFLYDYLSDKTTIIQQIPDDFNPPNSYKKSSRQRGPRISLLQKETS
jgi:hypothetical protein